MIHLFFENSIWAIRIFSFLVVWLTAIFLTCFAANLNINDRYSQLTIATLYPLVINFTGGFSSKSQIILNLLICLALFLASHNRFKDGINLGRSILIGIILAVMFQTNYMAGFLILYFSIFYFLFVSHGRYFNSYARVYFLNGLLIFLSFIVMNMMILLPIFIWSNITEYFSMQLSFLQIYSSERGSVIAWLAYSVYYTALAINEYFVIISFIIIASIFLCINQKYTLLNRDSKNQLAIFCSYFAIAIIIPYINNRVMDYYFLFSVPPMIILFVILIERVFLDWRARNLVLAWSVLAHVGLQWINDDIYDRGLKAYAALLTGKPADVTAQIADDLSPFGISDGELFVFDYGLALYVLLDVSPPTQLAHPMHHIYPDLAGALGTQPEVEIARIIDTSPRFIVAGPRPLEFPFLDLLSFFDEQLDGRYELFKHYHDFDREVSVYRRIDDKSPTDTL